MSAKRKARRDVERVEVRKEKIQPANPRNPPAGVTRQASKHATREGEKRLASGATGRRGPPRKAKKIDRASYAGVLLSAQAAMRRQEAEVNRARLLRQA